MDWIERLTGWDPDGGNGFVEALLIVAAVLVLLILSRTLRRALRRAVEPPPAPEDLDHRP